MGQECSKCYLLISAEETYAEGRRTGTIKSAGIFTKKPDMGDSDICKLFGTPFSFLFQESELNTTRVYILYTA